MASLYTDEVRLARYEKFRKRAKCCDIVFGISMWALVLIGLDEIVQQLSDGLFNGLLSGKLVPFFIMLAVIAEAVFSVYASYRRDWRLLFGVLICAAVFAAVGFYGSFGQLSVLPLLASAAVSLVWRKLEQEEGFPRFEITYAEQSARQKTQEQYFQNRIVTPEHEDMMDEL